MAITRRPARSLSLPSEAQTFLNSGVFCVASQRAGWLGDESVRKEVVDPPLWCVVHLCSYDKLGTVPCSAVHFGEQ